MKAEKSPCPDGDNRPRRICSAPFPAGGIGVTRKHVAQGNRVLSSKSLGKRILILWSPINRHPRFRGNDGGCTTYRVRMRLPCCQAGEPVLAWTEVV